MYITSKTRSAVPLDLEAVQIEIGSTEQIDERQKICSLSSWHLNGDTAPVPLDWDLHQLALLHLQLSDCASRDLSASISP